MDSRLRELERRWHGGEITPELAMLYLSTLKRTGGKVRLRRFPTPQVGIHVRRGRETQPVGLPWGTVFWYVVNDNIKPETHCKHKHTTKRNAVKCARRYAYNLILESDDAELICRHLQVGTK